MENQKLTGGGGGMLSLKTKKANGGFTLIELMVVIMMIAILSSIAVPSLGRWMSNMDAQGNAMDIYMAIKNARMQAIKNSENINVTIDPGNGNYTITNGAGDVYLNDDIGDSLVVGTNTIGNTFFFNSRGIPSSSGSFELDRSSSGPVVSYKAIDLYVTGMSKIRSM